jgi:transcriptional regulator of acetoin/glycerol metabolism
MARLQAHDWPGNIRELRNVIDRARLFADDGIIQVENLGLDTSPALAGPVSTSAAPASAGARYDGTELARLAASFSGTRRELAQRVGLSERTLYRRLKALGLA